MPPSADQFSPPRLPASLSILVSSTVTGRGAGWSLGTFIGYSFVLGDRWNVRVGAGAQYMSYAVDAGSTRIEWKRFHPALDLIIGYGF